EQRTEETETAHCPLPRREYHSLPLTTESKLPPSPPRGLAPRTRTRNRDRATFRSRILPIRLPAEGRERLESLQPGSDRRAQREIPSFPPPPREYRPLAESL